MAIIAVGSINTDLVVRVESFPIPGETVYGDEFATYAGGKGANQAAAAARLNGNVKMIGAVGDDANSSERLADLKDAGVDISPVMIRSQSPGGVALIQVDASGQNQIVIVPGANGTVSPDDVRHELPDLLSAGDLVLLQFELPFETVKQSLEQCRSHSARSIVNTAPYVTGTADLLNLIDILVVNEIEAGQLLGIKPVSLDQAEDAARDLLARGPEVVFVTLGGDGAVICDADSCEHIPAPDVDVVDTTGAGDATVGAFAMALDEGQDVASAARIAVMTGSFAVQRPGAQPSQPTRAELDAFVAKHS
ncbi:MAG: ribokinase [Sphaerobacteraceae bacterium]|nr:MAG: ribokinase [Sphaerobacteraceae bacterium]